MKKSTKFELRFLFIIHVTNFRKSFLFQTDHDFNLEKQNLVHTGKLKVQEEYAQKEKDLEIEQRVLDFVEFIDFDRVDMSNQFTLCFCGCCQN